MNSSFQELLERQRGVVTRSDAARHGISDDAVSHLVHRGAWQSLHRGVYAAFSGEPARAALLWAAILRAGPGAMLSHHTAAELLGLARDRAAVIHVTVPAGRHPQSISGVRVHRSSRTGTTMHPAGLPPRTRVEETVLDLADSSVTLDEACGWVFRAVSGRLTTAGLLGLALDARSRARWRAGLAEMLSDAGAGAHSILEQRYARDVERAHGLPAAARQVPVTLAGRMAYLDNFYEEAMLAVELDGQAAHGLDRRWADMRRDNLLAVRGIVTMRYSWADTTTRPCTVAGQVAEVLRRRSATPVSPRPCGPACAIAESRAS